MERIMYFFMDVVLPVMWVGAIIVAIIFHIVWRMGRIGKVKFQFKKPETPEKP